MESYGAKVVGVNSYGKGTVQVTENLRSGGMIKYTIQKWLSPEGNWINEKGVTPTHKVELSKEYELNPIKENDNQLQKALDVVSK
jgi:carboxyl-terminal processing protease